jgi:sec-independent protein translocase protein TatC
MADEPLEPIPNPEEEEEGGPVKTFLEHLEDLRWVLVRCFASLLLGMVTCLVAAKYVTSFLKRPLIESEVPVSLESFGPIGGMVIAMKIALYGGITLALPFVLYFVADFILPALKKHEKKYFSRAFVIGGGLFLAGMALCYFLVLEISLRGLYGFNKWLGLGANLWRAEEYFHFAIMFMIGMGLSFELPVVLLTLVRMGVISHQTLVKSRAYLLIGNMVICAFITPDAVSTLFMVVPVQGLIEICILISRHWERQKRLAEATAVASEKHLRVTTLILLIIGMTAAGLLAARATGVL